MGARVSTRANGTAKPKRVRHPRYLLFLTLLLLLPWPLLMVLRVEEALITAFDLAVLVFIVTCVPLWRNGDARTVRHEAERDDAQQGLLLLLTALITATVLVALSILVLDEDGLDAVEIALLVSTLAASWGFANLVYAFHYARLYYAEVQGGDHEGLDFPGDGEPGFSDFVNFAFVIGMTCQTADIVITSPNMRRIATWHGLFAFMFNLGILALTINVLAGI